tara:strand:+ start:1461 stop:2291 length:831 start_codon:yes stop_codon:yes gene_type:complete
MVSYLKIKLVIDGDYKGNVTFTPSMSDDAIKTKEIFFPPMFKLSNSLISKAVPDSINPKEVLTSQGMYSRLVKYATDSTKGYKKISIQDADKSGIIEDNIKYMMKLWLPNNSSIMLNNRTYNIVSTSFEKKDRIINQPTNYTAHIRVRVIQKERDNFVDREKMTCDDKRAKINKMYQELFGGIFFSYRDPSNKDIKMAPTMQTNIYGQTTKKTQIAQNNFAPVGRVGIAPYGMMPAAPFAFVQPVIPRGGKNIHKSRRKKKHRPKRKGRTRKIKRH